MQQSEYWYFSPHFFLFSVDDLLIVINCIYEWKFLISDNLTVVTTEQFNPLNDNSKRPKQTNDDADESETNSKSISIDKVLNSWSTFF